MISVTILTKNSARYLPQVLQALHLFDEVAILDTGSTDSTLEIAAKFQNVTIHRGFLSGFGEAHNNISSLAKHDWILSIDSDEIASDELVQEILATKLDPKTVYSIKRHNFYRGKFIKGCGWYPDRVVRLYNKKETRFTDAKVHESIIQEGMHKVAFKAPLNHFPYNSIDDFMKKMHLYTSFFAQDYQAKKTGSMSKAVGHGLFAFTKSYVLKRGVLLGSEGFEISVYNGITAYYKYLKLRDANELNTKV